MKGKRLLDLSVEAIEPKNKYEHPPPYHAHLPKHEFSMLIVAPKGSGKTNLLCNLITKHYKGYFHRILVCSPTVMNDEKWTVVKKTKHVLAENKKLQEVLDNRKRGSKIKKVVFSEKEPLEKQLKDLEEKFDGIIPEEDFFTDLSMVPEKIKEQQAVIKELHDKGREEQAKFIADRLLVILDDQAGMFKGGNVNNPMVNYVIKHRHASSSVIIVTQAYKAIPKTIRTNCNALIVFRIPNFSELHAIYEENPEDLSEEEWLRLYDHATKEDYSFLYINNKFRKRETVFKRFERMLKLKVVSARDKEGDSDIEDTTTTATD